MHASLATGNHASWTSSYAPLGSTRVAVGLAMTDAFRRMRRATSTLPFAVDSDFASSLTVAQVARAQATVTRCFVRVSSSYFITRTHAGCRMHHEIGLSLVCVQAHVVSSDV